MIPQIISFKCILKSLTGQIISTTYNKDVLTSINDEHAFLTGLSKGLQNLQTGDKRKIQLKAEEAYGFYDPSKVVYFPKKRISKDVTNGEIVTLIMKNGAAKSYKVVGIHSDMVSLDGNHPLAGQDLVFEIETLSARNATSDEINAAHNNMSTQLLH